MIAPGVGGVKKPSFAPKVFASSKITPKTEELASTIITLPSKSVTNSSDKKDIRKIDPSEKDTLIFEDGSASDDEDDEDLRIFNSHKRKHSKAVTVSSKNKINDNKSSKLNEISSLFVMETDGVLPFSSLSSSLLNNKNKPVAQPSKAVPINRTVIEIIQPNISLKKKSKKPVNAYELFPISFKQPEKYDRITTYFKKTHEGIEGLEFKNIDGKPLIASIDYDIINMENSEGGKKVRVDDLVLSVNNVDSRYSSFDRIMTELKYRDSNINLSGDARSAVKHAVSDNLAVIVFARITVA